MAKCLFLVAALWAGSIWAVDYTARLTQVSSSGKTLLIDRGFHEDIKTGDFGILMAVERVERGKGMRPRALYRPAAKIKAIKTYSDSSLWVAYKIFEPARLRANAEFLLLSENALLKGARPLEVKKKILVDRKEKIGQALKSELTGEERELIEKGDNWKVRAHLEKPSPYEEADATLVDLEVWEESAVAGEARAQGFYKGPSAQDFAQRLRVERFEKMAALFMKKRNDPNFTLQNLYEDKGGDKLVLNPKSELRGRKREELRQILLAKGESWSDDYTDEELSELLYNVGAVVERERRQAAGAAFFDYQATLSAGLNLLDNENLNDQRNTESAKYDVEVLLDWFVFKKLPVLRPVVLEGSFRRAQDAFSSNGLNILGEEYSFAFGLTWHPFAPPNAMERNIFFAGLYFRYGWGSYSIPSAGENGVYQVYSFPGLKTGLKYNFQNGYGLRLSASFENILADRIERDVEGGSLPDRVGHLEGKLSVGLSRFF